MQKPQKQSEQARRMQRKGTRKDSGFSWKTCDGGSNSEEDSKALQVQKKRCRRQNRQHPLMDLFES